MKKKLLPLAWVFVSMSSMAGEFTVTKTATPGTLSRTSGKAISVHRISGTDYPAAARRSGALVGVSWNIASYPGSESETAEICMNRQGAAQDCISITPGSTGNTPYFNHPVLGYASFIVVKHSRTGGPLMGHPAGNDSVTFHVRY